jgi:hypothetical protein
MAAKPTLVLNEGAVRFALALGVQQRQKLVKALEALVSYPQAEADFHEVDLTGRKFSVVAVRPFLVTYWWDGAVDELRIVDIQRVKS